MKQSTRDAIEHIKLLEEQKSDLDKQINEIRKWILEESEYKYGSLHFVELGYTSLNGEHNPDQRDAKVTGLIHGYDRSSKELKVFIEFRPKLKGNKVRYSSKLKYVSPDQIIMPL